jgi:hypothetical protein
MLHPLHAEFGWPLATISEAVSVNLVLFGLTAPFAAALMEKFGIRRVDRLLQPSRHRGASGELDGARPRTAV